MYPTSDFDIKAITAYVSSVGKPVTKTQVFEHMKIRYRSNQKSRAGSDEEQWKMFSRNFDALLDNGTLFVSC